MSVWHWSALLFTCMACMGPPDVVAIRDEASLGGEASGAAGAAGGGVADEAGGAGGEPAEVVPLVGFVEGHDPSALFDNGKLWIVSGSSGVSVRSTSDLVNVEEEGQILQERPAWVATEVPDAQSIWSPELAYFDGLYHLYYAVSTLGSSRSCIGHATASVLAVASTWQDRGPVICSKATDDYNAIDPNVLVMPDGSPWLVFGSYLSGIRVAQLDSTGQRLSSEPVTVAARPNAGGALQAPALAEHGGFYYLFISFGAESSHRLMMGRATAIEGPYVDKSGTPLLEGGGSALLEANTRFRGPGSNDVFEIDGQHYNIFHAYDAERNGSSTLRLSELSWDNAGWPESGGP